MASQITIKFKANWTLLCGVGLSCMTSKIYFVAEGFVTNLTVQLFLQARTSVTPLMKLEVVFGNKFSSTFIASVISQLGVGAFMQFHF